MVVIPSSQLELSRQCKQVSAALQRRDWASIQRLDTVLVERVASAADDPGRDLPTLLNELRLVVGLYRDLLQHCDNSVREVAEGLLK